MITTDLRTLLKTTLLQSVCRILLLGALMVHLAGCANKSPISPNSDLETTQSPSMQLCTASNTIKAEVVALEQTYFYNRFGAFNPSGMIYALRRDVVENFNDDDAPMSAEKTKNKNTETQIKSYDRNDPQYDLKLAGNVKLRSDKRPRPLILRANEGDCLEITFTNLLARGPDGQSVYLRDSKTGLFNIEGQEAALIDPKQSSILVVDGEDPSTRHASMHVNGLNYIPDEADAAGGIMSDGSNVGRNPPPKTQIPNTGFNICSSKVSDFGKDHCSLAAPGETRIYRW